MNELDKPCVLHLARKQMVLNNLRAHIKLHYPDSSVETCALLVDIGHDLQRADAAEKEISSLNRSVLRLREAYARRDRLSAA